MTWRYCAVRVPVFRTRSCTVAAESAGSMPGIRSGTVSGLMNLSSVAASAAGWGVSGGAQPPNSTGVPAESVAVIS